MCVMVFFSSDARFIGGLCYDLISIPEVSNTYPWWATIERSKKQRTPVCPLNINIATVKELEDVLALDPITAREIIEHKLIIEQYSTIYELVDTYIISTPAFERIKQCISIR